MCNPACIETLASWITASEVEGKDVLEAGARDVNGSIRPYIESLKPRSYIGTDIVPGPKVDHICDAGRLVEEFGERVFDLVISTEMMEHVEDWRGIISNFKRLLRPGGIVAITTRSRGFGYHGYPADYWRYEVDDMRVIFEDFKIQNLITDPSEPGVFIKAKRPMRFKEKDLSSYNLYAITKDG